MTAQAGARPRERGVVLPLLSLAAALAVLVALGTWQLERLHWKEGLIANLDAKLAAPAIDIPPPERWSRLDQAKDEFRHVAFSAEFVRGEEALVYTSGSPLRPDVSGPGYWVFAPARLAGGGVVLVNRGFVPEGRQDQKTRPQGEPVGVVEIKGALRWPEPRGGFTPNDDLARGIWFARDPAAMAKAKNWGTIAPFYVDQEGPAPTNGIPQPGPLKPALPNRHLEYAVTWYGLALVILIAAAFFVRARRREA